MVSSWYIPEDGEYISFGLFGLVFAVVDLLGRDHSNTRCEAFPLLNIF